MKSLLAPFFAALIFSALAVYFVLLNGALVSEGGILEGYSALILICICVSTASIFAVLAAKAFKSRFWLGTTAVAAGMAMPVVVIATPLVYCLLFRCSGFDWI